VKRRERRAPALKKKPHGSISEPGGLVNLCAASL